MTKTLKRQNNGSYYKILCVGKIYGVYKFLINHPHRQEFQGIFHNEIDARTYILDQEPRRPLVIKTIGCSNEKV